MAGRIPGTQTASRAGPERESSEQRTKKTVLIGAGTVGCRCVLGAKELAIRNFSRDYIRDNLGFLFVDTRQSEFENFPEEVRPGANERVEIGPVNVPKMQEYAEVHQGLHKMTPLEEIQSVTKRTEEAQQLRPAGAAALYSDWDEARAKYKSMFQQLLEIGPGRDSGNPVINVWRVFHGSGGTGSGSAWLDAHLIKSIAKETGDFRIRLKAVVIMPEAVNAPDDPRAVENFAALLKEHDNIAEAVYHDEDRSISMYDPTSDPSPYPDPYDEHLYDDFVLIAPFTERGWAYARTFDVVSQLLFDVISPGIGSELQDPIPDMAQEHEMALEPRADKRHPKELWSLGRYEYQTGQPLVVRACAIREARRGLQLGYLSEASDDQVTSLVDRITEHVGPDALKKAGREHRPDRVSLIGVRDASEDTLPSKLERQLQAEESSHEHEMEDLETRIVGAARDRFEKVHRVIDQHLETETQGLDASVRAAEKVREALRQASSEIEEELEQKRKRLDDLQETREEKKNDVISANRKWLRRGHHVDEAVSELESAIYDVHTTDYEVTQLRSLERALRRVRNDLDALLEDLRRTRNEVQGLVAALEDEEEGIWSRQGEIPTVWVDAGPEDVDENYPPRMQENDEGLARETVESLPISLTDDANSQTLKEQIIETFRGQFNDIEGIPFAEWVSRKTDHGPDMADFMTSLQEKASRALPLMEDADGGDPNRKIIIELPKGAGELKNAAQSDAKTVRGDDKHRLRIIRASEGAAKSAIPTWNQMRQAYEEKLDDPDAQPLHVLEHLFDFKTTEEKFQTGCAAIALGYLRPTAPHSNHWFLYEPGTGNQKEPKFAYGWDGVKESLATDSSTFDTLTRWIQSQRTTEGAKELARKLYKFELDPEGIPDLAEQEIIEGIRGFMKSDPELRKLRHEVKGEIQGFPEKPEAPEPEPDREKRRGTGETSDEPPEEGEPPEADRIEGDPPDKGGKDPTDTGEGAGTPREPPTGPRDTEGAEPSPEPEEDTSDEPFSEAEDTTGDDSPEQD